MTDKASKTLYEPETDMEFANIISANKCPVCNALHTYRCKMKDTADGVHYEHYTHVHIERLYLTFKNKVRRISKQDIIKNKVRRISKRDRMLKRF